MNQVIYSSTSIFVPVLFSFACFQSDPGSCGRGAPDARSCSSTLITRIIVQAHSTVLLLLFYFLMKVQAQSQF